MCTKLIRDWVCMAISIMVRAGVLNHVFQSKTQRLHLSTNRHIEIVSGASSQLDITFVIHCDDYQRTYSLAGALKMYYFGRLPNRPRTI